MSTLVQAALTFRRGARSSYGYLVALAVGALTVLGVFRDQSALAVQHALVGVTWIVVFGSRASSRMRARAEKAQSWFDLELGLLSLAAAHSLLQLFGGVMSPLYPALYVFVAFVSSFADRSIGRALLLVALVYEGLLYFVTEGHTDPQPFALHAIFLTLFGLLNVLFTQGELQRMRSHSARELRDERARVQADARLFRLAATPSDAPARDEEKLFRSSVDEVHQALFFNLELLKRTMGLHSCVLLMLDDAGSKLRIVECATDSDDLAEGPFVTGGGAVGAVLQRGLPMNLERLRPGYGGIAYYRGPAVVQAFACVPVVDRGEIRGVLCADRLQDRSFDQQEIDTLRGAVGHVLRALENERVFVQLERSKREHGILRQASEALGAALTESAVLDAVLEAAHAIVQFDFAAVTRYEGETGKHEVLRAVGEGADALGQLSFRDNTSLTAMAVKNRHYLPYRGEYNPSQVVYTRKANLNGMQSLLILPLLVRDTPIGTFALAAKAPGVFNNSVRAVLQVLGNQLGVALSNAASVKRLEELATTDGLTGCYNKRYFNEEFQARLQAAERFGRKLSLIITDIDHFKVVNDTYGHATGDVVIKELGEILRRLKRDTDIVARFGGEEFCVLCEETDTDGALRLAERLRVELEQTVFESELGKLKVTCSLGVATYPQAAQDRGALFEAADRALYKAKEGGRNQVRSA